MNLLLRIYMCRPAGLNMRGLDADAIEELSRKKLIASGRGELFITKIGIIELRAKGAIK